MLISLYSRPSRGPQISALAGFPSVVTKLADSEYQPARSDITMINVALAPPH